jgi:hypothetical protein
MSRAQLDAKLLEEAAIVARAVANVKPGQTPLTADAIYRAAQLYRGQANSANHPQISHRIPELSRSDVIDRNTTVAGRPRPPPIPLRTMVGRLACVDPGKLFSRAWHCTV